MRTPICLLVCSMVTLPAAPAAASVSFADQQTGLVSGALVYPGATFSSGTGNLYVGAAGGDHAVCAYARSSCANAFSVVFDAPVDNLSFLADGDDSAASSLYVTGTTSTGDFSFTGSGFDGNVHTTTLFDLSVVHGITGLTITSNDIKGLGYDMFSFEMPLSEGGSGSTVPEPGTWGLLAVGMAVTGAFLRRRRGAGYTVTA